MKNYNDLWLYPAITSMHRLKELPNCLRKGCVLSEIGHYISLVMIRLALGIISFPVKFLEHVRFCSQKLYTLKNKTQKN